MKRIGLFLFSLIPASLLCPEEQATTDSGLRVTLYDDGIWTYVSESETDTKWRAGVKTDPIDDSRVVTYLLEADSGESSWGNPIYLVIRDIDGQFELFIKWEEYLGSEVSVTHRVDDQRAITQMWSLSTDGKASFYRRSANPSLSQLLDQFMDAQQFVARSTPYGQNPTTVIFDIRGLKQIMEEHNSQLPPE